MHKILIDTCVWLDIAKDPEQQGLLSVIEELVRINELAIIIPRTVFDEYERNKERIIKESGKSLSGVFKRVKEVVEKFGDPRKKQSILEGLNDVDYKIPFLGESTNSSISRIDKLFQDSTIIETTDAIKLRAVQRAIENKAPFHLNKNSINDAILMETYADCLQNSDSKKNRFAFVTHNKKDFSLQNGNEKLPHPDFANCFSKYKSQYFLSLGEAVQRIRPDLVSDIMIENEWIEEPRSLSEIFEAEAEFFNKVWYNRHQNYVYMIAKGKMKLIDREKFEIKTAQSTMVKEIWKTAQEAARNVENQYGIENLGPWTDFEWGMVNGKLSALRWVTGDDWDNLDT